MNPFGLKKYHRDECLERMRRFCVYRERCVLECREKLKSFGYRSLEADEIINQLFSENFLDETRFAESFARGKFNQNNWGRTKIEWELKCKGISPFNIKKGLQAIGDAEYQEKLENLYRIKLKDYRGKGLNAFQLKQKVNHFLASKGFEWKAINDLDLPE